MKQAPLTVRRWARDEYERLVDAGVFHGESLELIGGHLVVAEPQGTYHASSTGAAGDVLRAALPPGWLVRVQMPLALDDESAPEPDLAVVPGTWSDYRASHPARPVLVVEIAESSLAFDRRYKGSLYARAGLADYWILNLVDRILEVYRDPGPDPLAPYGWSYRSLDRLGPSTTASPLALPSVHIPVRRFLS